MPLAENNFRDMPWVDIKFEKRLALFYQTLSGLAELHQQKIIHGNILPESLLILAEPKPATLAKRQSTPRRAVISLNMRERKKTPDASVCIAPEVWEREKQDDKDLDETKLDIWALAVSWLFAFTTPPKNMKIRKQSYSGLKSTLDTQTKRGFIKEPLAMLLRQMLAWEPKDRPTATEALADEVWKPIRDEKQKEEDTKKRRRMEMLQGEKRDKRVKVLSPNIDE
jgi:serine/threonine protein kinase